MNLKLATTIWTAFKLAFVLYLTGFWLKYSNFETLEHGLVFFVVYSISLVSIGEMIDSWYKAVR